MGTDFWPPLYLAVITYDVTESETIWTCFSARTDGLKAREETPAKLTEHYCDRDDCLTKRLVNYTKRVKKFGPAEGNEKPVNVSACEYLCITANKICLRNSSVTTIKLLLVERDNKIIDRTAHETNL